MSRAEAGAPRVPSVLCAGIAVLDMVFRVESFPTPQAKGRAEDLVATGGGCAASAAVAIARLGGRARLAAPLGGPAGADRIGDEILAGLAAEEVDCAHCVRLAGTPSPMSAILVAAAGERMIVNHRDERLATARVPDPEGLAEGADLLLADNLFPQFVAPICRAFRRKGRVVVLSFHTKPVTIEDLTRDFYHKELDILATRATGPSNAHRSPQVRWTSGENLRLIERFIAQGRLHPELLISGRLPLAQIEEGLRQVETEPERVVKLLIEW